MNVPDFFHAGYKDAWFGHPLPSGATEEYRRGHAEGREHRRRADIRRDASTYHTHVGIARMNREWAGAWRGRE